MGSSKLSVVIPLYNEGGKIKKTFLRIDRFFSKRNYVMEYIFVEDGSPDETLRVLSSIEKERSDVRVLVNEKNMGKGYSIKKGMLSATGEHILFMDADMSTSLKAFPNFEKHFRDYDIIMGSRWCKEADIKVMQPWHRRFLGIIFYKILNLFFLKNVTDANCGFKCYRKDVARDIFSKQLLRGWGFDAELLYIAEKRKYRIKEVPVAWAHGMDSKVNLLTVPAKTIVELVKIKINDRKKRYEK
ncbi:MAG: glycosyltransferase family 2 protein [Omnitrophica bacterium]|nr:glycosyltransferase family 2 protein [Candidatus Omnitrophota bacterium]